MLLKGYAKFKTCMKLNSDFALQQMYAVRIHPKRIELIQARHLDKLSALREKHAQEIRDNEVRAKRLGDEIRRARKKVRCALNGHVHARIACLGYLKV